MSVPLAVSAKPFFNIFDFVHGPLQPNTEFFRFRYPIIKHQVSNAGSLNILKMQISQEMIYLRSINRGVFGILS